MIYRTNIIKDKKTGMHSLHIPYEIADELRPLWRSQLFLMANNQLYAIRNSKDDLIDWCQRLSAEHDDITIDTTRLPVGIVDGDE